MNSDFMGIAAHAAYGRQMEADRRAVREANHVYVEVAAKAHRTPRTVRAEAAEKIESLRQRLVSLQQQIEQAQVEMDDWERIKSS